MWAITGPNDGSSVLNSLDLQNNAFLSARDNSKVTGFSWMIFFSVSPRPLSATQLSAWQKRTIDDLPARVHRHLSVVIYDHDVNTRQRPTWDTNYGQYLQQVDEITLWFDYQKWLSSMPSSPSNPPASDTTYINSVLTTLESRIASLPNRPRIVLGCYMFQLLGPSNYRGPISGTSYTTAFSQLLEFARVNIESGRLYGIIFLSNRLVDTALSSSNPARAAIDITTSWISSHGSEAVNPASRFTTTAIAGQIYSSPVIYDSGSTSVVAIGGYDGYMRAYNRNTAAAFWSANLGGQIYSTPAVSSAGSLYVGTLSGVFYSLNAASGAVNWSVSVPSGGAVWLIPSISAEC